MDPRKYQSGASASPPAPLASPSDGYPRSGDPGTGTPATVPGPYWHYAISEEMRNLILEAGLTPDYEDLTQFSQSINALISQNLLPVGTVLLRSGDVVPAGFFKRNGAEILRSTYSTHWAYVQTVSNFIDQATKDANPETYAGYYGDGDGSTTYTLPDDRGEFHRIWDDGRGVDSGRVIGSFQYDQMQRITGQVNISRTAQSSILFAEAEGGFSDLGAGATSVAVSGLESNTTRTLGFDSANSPNARASASTEGETRSRNISLMSIEKY